MNNHIEYEFQSEPDAYRFLNAVAQWQLRGLMVKFGRSSFHVRVSYLVQQTGFDNTLSELDELAAKENGAEVN